MITFAFRQRIVVLATVLAAALLPPASASAAVHAAAPANSCPLVGDRLFAAADQRAELDRITPTPSWRTNCKQLYRADGRPPAIVFAEGFHPKDTVGGQYDIEQYVLVNQPSPYVSTTYDHDLYKTWWKSGWNYYIDAPGGVDVNKTIGDTHKYASQAEVAFPGGIDRSFIVAVCPVDKVLKIEIMNECQDNPYYQPWRENYPG
ncbi:enterotoxin A family protein [Streptomyces sp. NBC_00249]|uniref:ADP-ribosyltransferase n=1 Tax=Streptomyces sp. NBC_00249 TaxID=2975690 RepID=UPI002257A40C|nr:ADP-ribosyltransferase [Streptomyces sp. NBC_00249]MCX5198149.1 enterotoxin A family protein [Streptomyces sp. NBC_00249]